MKTGKKVLLTILFAAAAGTLLWGSYRFLEQDYVFWNGSIFPRHTQTLSITGRKMRNVQSFLKFTDLRQLDARDTGMTIEQYRWFRQELPGCRVLWDVPIQGKYFSQDTTEISVEALTEAEINALQYLPDLCFLDVGTWEDHNQILALKQQYPACTVHCRVLIGEEVWDSDAVSLVIEDADGAELMEKLALFDRLESVLLTGTVPTQEVLQQLRDGYPEISFLWKMDVLGMSLETDITELDLIGVPLKTVEELENLLSYFPQLKKVDLTGTELPQKELVSLAARYPDTHFLFELTFGGLRLHTSAEEFDISNILLEDTAELEGILPCFHDLKKVIMCECGISSEEMDALNRKYGDIRFIWSVELAGMLFRTDAVYFTPNKWGIKCDDENIYDLRYCTDMVCVDIGHHIKVTNCEWVRFMPELKYLVLAETGISDLTPLENHENLVFLEIFLSKVKDYSPLTTCKALEDLNLCYTYGDAKPIGEMTWLKRLWWSGSWAARKYLADKLPDTYTEYLSLSSTGRGWREGQHYYDMRDFIGMDYMTG